MSDRQQYAVAAIAAAVLGDPKTFSLRPISLDQLARALSNRAVAEYATDQDLAAFVDFMVSSKVATLVQPPFARPRVIITVPKIFEAAQQSPHGSALKLWAETDTEVIFESLETLGLPKIADGKLLKEYAKELEEPSRPPNELEISPELGWSQPAVGSGALPASDRYVPLDHNSARFKEMIVSLDDAIRAIDGLNDELGLETATRVVELHAGRRLLEAQQIDLRFVEDIIVRALRDLAARTFNVLADNAINAALLAVITYFGLSL